MAAAGVSPFSQQHFMCLRPTPPWHERLMINLEIGFMFLIPDSLGVLQIDGNREGSVGTSIFIWYYIEFWITFFLTLGNFITE
jgi:hypothetical protein